jgi:hypothetical protein
MADFNREKDGRGAAPPYIAFQTLKTFVGNLKPHKLPNRIDRSLLGNFSGGVQGQLITALRFLGLIDAKGYPQAEKLEPLVQAFGTDQWSAELERLLRDSFAPMFDIDLAAASPAQFNEHWRGSFEGGEQVQRKAITFFLNAARETDIEISPHILRDRKPRSGGAPGRRRAVRQRFPAAAVPEPTIASASEPTTAAPRPNATGTLPRAPNAYELLAVFDPNDMSETEQAAVWTLIQYLKRKETAAR